MQLVKPVVVSALIAIAGAAAGCVVTPGTVTYSGSASIYDSSSPTNSGREPVIHAFTPSVTSIDKDGAITFTVVANAPSGRPLQYNWSATKGLLSGNSGQTVSWRPLKLDGSLDVGIATITVILSDGQYSTTGTVNIQVTAGGTATVVGTSGAAASPSPSPAATATATPAPAASPSASPAASATPAATPTPEATATAAPAASGAASPSPGASAKADTAATADAAATK
jgi:hypothetical protein